MFGIETVASYVPEARVNNLENLEKFNITKEFLDTKIGACTLPIKAETEETSDLGVKAVGALIARTGLKKADIDGLILCTQNPDSFGLPHTSAIVHGKLGLEKHCAAFDISLGCSGFVYGASVVSAFAEAHGLKNVVLVTSDPYSKVVAPSDKNTRLLFGDAATATLFSSGTRRLVVRKALFGTDGALGSALRVREDRQLEMNGRAVFNFSATTVPNQVRDLLAQSDMTIDDVDYFLFHQGSKYILDTLTKRLKLPQKKIVTTLAETGNTVSSSIPLLLENLIQKNVPANRLLVSGFGVGLSYASAILEWKSDD